MWTGASNDFINCLSNGGTVVVGITIYDLSGTSVDDAVMGLSTMLDGSSVTVDRSADVRRTLTLNVPYGGIFTKENFGPLSGHEFLVKRGFMINGSPEMAPLGLFHTDTMEIVYEGTAKQLKITASDRAGLCQTARFKEPYTITAGTLYPAAIKDLVDLCMRGRAYSYYLGENIDALPRLVYDEKETPWEKASDLAAAISTEIFFDASGQFIFRGLTEDFLQSGAQAWYGTDLLVDPGDKIIAGEFKVSESSKNIINGVVVRGSAPWLLTPVRGEWWDDNPVSPTYRYGLLGEMPLDIENPTVLDNAQAEQMAKDHYGRRAGVTQRIEFNSLVDPRLDNGDLIKITHEQSGISGGLYIVERITIPLGYSEKMFAEVKTRSEDPNA
jgi:hypothetical protein